MSKARSSSGMSCIVGVDKPKGLSSHDVVNVCRQAFGERRCGHMGTLDPDASGALIVCVGPATRLDAYLAGHSKEYVFTIVFGSATDTDDAQGKVIRVCDVPARLGDEGFACKYVSGLVGWHDQVPPAFSAVHVNGKRSYDEARKGHIVQIQPRRIHIEQAQLEKVERELDGERIIWTVRASVSAGTYIRAIARDVGVALKTCAHVGDLRRTRTGNLSVDACVDLDAIRENPCAQLIDPVRLLGFRFVFAGDEVSGAVKNGRTIPRSRFRLFSYRNPVQPNGSVSCSSDVQSSDQPPADGEMVSVVAHNRLQALYTFDADHDLYRAKCVFAIGVRRGFDIDC